MFGGGEEELGVKSRTSGGGEAWVGIKGGGEEEEDEEEEEEEDCLISSLNIAVNSSFWEVSGEKSGEVMHR